LFKKTRDTIQRLKNMFWSRYELSFKQQTLFNVTINDDPTFVVIGTVKPGTFDYVLEPITYLTSETISRVRVSHMNLSSKEILLRGGPIYMVVGDQFIITYERQLTM
jgi:hypothetical protein